VSKRNKNKESDFTMDSSQISDDVLEALVEASEVDETEFYDALTNFDNAHDSEGMPAGTALPELKAFTDKGDKTDVSRQSEDLYSDFESTSVPPPIADESFENELSKAAKDLEAAIEDTSHLDNATEILSEPEPEPEPKASGFSADDFPTRAFGVVKEVDEPASGRNPLIDLKNADYIKFAQDKIKKLEKQLFELRSECEELARAGDHFKNLSEEKNQKIKAYEAKVEGLESLSKEEKDILQESMSSKDLRISTLQEKIENLENELGSKYSRIRERERDLEGRLEILKKEQHVVTKSKDEMLLKLKGQNESLKADIEKLRARSQKVTSHLHEKEDALRRTMKALKLSLTMLESQNKD